MSQFQALENRMYRAPIFEQPMAVTYFIVIQSGIEFFIRLADSMFVVGQEIPLVRVPAPVSKGDTNLNKRFLQV